MLEQIRDIDALHSTVKRGVLELKRRLKEHGYDMGVSETYRTNERQDYLYEQGRTRPGPIITNAKGGQSIHNYKLAFDIFNNIKGQEYDGVFMNLAGKIGMEIGFNWGGSWSGFVDKPHYEFTNGLSLSQLQKGASFSGDILMKWEVKLMEELKVELEKLSAIVKTLTTELSDIKVKLDSLNEVVYNTLDEVPDWGRKTIKKLMDKGVIVGDSENNVNLNVSYDMLRIYVTEDRLGVYDNIEK